jgi:hypothetical protein
MAGRVRHRSGLHRCGVNGLQSTLNWRLDGRVRRNGVSAWGCLSMEGLL